jgi:hypothetical protein
MSTVFVTLCDQGYYPKARRTIDELRTRGQWRGDVVLVAVDFKPEPLPNVLVWEVTHVDTSNLVGQLKEHPLRQQADNRHLGKLYQWDKLYAFHECFRRWERVVFLDAGLRVFDSVQPLLDLEWRGKFLAPDDADPYDNGNRFGVQLDFPANPAVAYKLLENFSEDILMERYFLNCMFVYDTQLLNRTSMQEMVDMMNAYPICMCNEMGILNLVFTFKLRVWSAFPQQVGSKYLFGWNESNYRERPDWRSFHFVKYSSTF